MCCCCCCGFFCFAIRFCCVHFVTMRWFSENINFHSIKIKLKTTNANKRSKIFHKLSDFSSSRCACTLYLASELFFSLSILSFIGVFYSRFFSGRFRLNAMPIYSLDFNSTKTKPFSQSRIANREKRAE